MPISDVTQEFCQNPETFMENNVVLILERFVPCDTPAGLQYFTCHAGGATVANKPNAKVCFLRLARATDAPALPAYWCPYGQDSLKSVMLGNDALFVFTPTMNGCSLGLGSSNGGSQMMHHVNAAKIGKQWGATYGENVGRQRQQVSQYNQLKYIKNSDFILHPGAYQQDASGHFTLNSTTFGVHALGRPWIVKTLTYRKSGGTYYHNGVRQHTV